MKNSTKIVLTAGAMILLAGGGFAFAQMDGPPPPDGPMQGLMHSHGKAADRFLAEFDLNHDGKVTRDEMNKAVAARFAAATHGSGTITLDQFAVLHMGEFQQHTAQLFHRLDWNGDGRLSLDEYAGPQRVRFETLDQDGSGTEPCAGRMIHAVYHAGETASGRHGGGRGFGRARFCSDNDLNRDGKVTRGEFDAATAKHFAAAVSGADSMTQAQFTADVLAHYRDLNAKLFQRLDKDKDGKLTLAEFAASDQKLFARMDKNGDGTVTKDELSSRVARSRPRGSRMNRT